MKKKSKRSKNKKNFYFSIYCRIKAGKRPNQIAKEFDVSKQKLNYYVSFLKKQGFIEKKGYGTWQIKKLVQDLELEKQLQKEVKKRSKKKSSIGLKINKPITNLHALTIKFPILKGKLYDSEWEVKNKLRNWLPKYKGLDALGGLTIRNNNNKSLTIFAKARDILNLEEIDNLAFKIRTYVHEYFKKKHNVILDVFNCETKNLHLATEDKESESMLRKGERFELDLKKKAEKIFPKDNLNASAWIDGSPFKFTAETNDKEWKRSYLQMPFAVQNINQSMFLMNEYNRNLKLHTKVQEEQLKTQKQIQKYLKKLEGGNS